MIVTGRPIARHIPSAPPNRFLPTYDLAPPNATDLEWALINLAGVLDTIDIPITDLYNPDRCPIAFLPFLAWALNVDDWDTDWPNELKRQVIRTAISTHRTKGTRFAVEQALDAVGVNAEIVEWFETEPKGEPGTFRLIFRVRDNASVDNGSLLTQDNLDRVRTLVDRVKQLAAHYTIEIQERFDGAVRFAGAVQITETLRIRSTLV